MKTLARLGLDAETTTLLLDWCAANYGASATNVIEEALPLLLALQANAKTARTP